MTERHVIDFERRFGGVARLYGKEGAASIRETHFCVVGVGGVGSWAVEALARTGAEKLTLIDLDNVAEGNTNRQIQALGEAYGMAKVEALKARIALINPRAEISCVEDFVDEENAADLIPADAIVLDCIDQVRAKAALIAHCRSRRQFIVVSGAGGGRTNPLEIREGDLGRISGDPLLASVRYRLRKEYGFPKASPDAGKPGKPLPPLFLLGGRNGGNPPPASLSGALRLFGRARQKALGRRSLQRGDDGGSCLLRVRLRHRRHVDLRHGGCFNCHA